MSKNIAIILLAGKGSRIKSNVPKQYIEINNKPIICYTIENFEKNSLIDEIIVVVDEKNIEFFKNEILIKYNFNKISKIVVGGKERAFSVKNALDSLTLNENTKDNVILIHDGARPFISEEVIEKGIETAKDFGSAIIGVKVKDTIKMVENENIILNTPNRESLWIAQTPQIFKLEIIKKAYDLLNTLDFIPTDDSSLVEQSGNRVKIVEGNYENFKITTPDDITFASIILGNI